MEEQKLRKHLIRIYVVTITAILAAMLAVVLLLFTREIDRKSRESFQTLMTAICDELQSGNVVSHSELHRLERENNLLLRIGDNGKAILYNSSDTADRKSLLSNVEAVAQQNGYDVESLPLTDGRRTSPAETFHAGGARYLGAVSILPMEGSFRTLTLAQRMDSFGIGRYVLYCASYVAGVLLLSAVGIRLIDRALLPAIESRKRQKQFVAAASHELRSPLAVIAANAAVLPEGARDSAAAGIIAAECERMSRLIGDLLLLASADVNTWTVSPEPLELDTLLLDRYEAYAPIFQTSGYQLSLLLPEGALVPIRADGERLKQVLSILLENALAYGVTAQSRAVELTVSSRRQRVTICVVDHGSGLTAEQKAHVFDRFYRGDDSRREKQHFGLGLSIASELISLNRGTLDVQDTPGGGCTFRIQLGV